ncbi:bestrophin family protein [Pedobacter rhizosphaerae]|uniref:Putative membrane protein n=1 Tax=Pedobacter rhizosphaerae TaxID=390241 RepID=A0A1H9TBN0_9SPHI|nr:bestrophin family ion channel [Pedobacter rhizosphaerae]SER94354.1 putative membrane protein [Pedobacter rhizosphaerae]
MLLVQNIRLSRILRNTWHVDLIMIASCTASYLVREYLIAHHFEIPSIIPTLLGTAIAFFIGFNNNQAYDRWWEARKVWGALVNDSRSFTRALLNYVDGEEETVKRMVYRHIAFLYALKANLRGTVDEIYIKYLNEADIKEMEKHKNMHNAILNIQSRDLQKLSKSSAIDGFRFIEINEMLVRFSDSMGMSERIKNTIFPTTYSYLTKVFIWLFVVTFTLVISQSAGVYSIFLGWLIGFVFVSTQINGMSLVNPFENNSAGVPLNQITRTIEINLLQMLGETDIPEPIKPINDEYVL